MKISIAMATYNGAKYLQEQLDSFVHQTLQPDELVITDDCSIDNTIQIIEDFTKKATFEVKWYQNELNLGYAGNFNRALSLTSGDLVFLSDQDDVWFPNKIEIMSKLAHEYPESLLLMNDAALTDAELRAVGLTKIGQIRSAGFKDAGFVMGCCAAIRRDLLEIALPVPNEFKSHDTWIARFAEGMDRKRIFNDILQYYRRHNRNESQFIVNSTKKITRRKVFLDQLFTLLERKNQEATNDSIYQHQLLLEGVKNARLKCKKKYINELIIYEKNIENIIYLTNKRTQVREKTRLRRIIPVLKMCMKGEYSIFSGLKTAMRDLVFK